MLAMICALILALFYCDIVFCFLRHIRRTYLLLKDSHEVPFEGWSKF